MHQDNIEEVSDSVMPGKPRKIIFFDDGKTLLIGDTERHITTWDTVTNCKISSTTLNSAIVDMAWTKLNEETFLIVLCANGVQYSFPCLGCAIGAPIECHERQVHDDESASICSGTLTCASSSVASTLGQDIAVQTLDGGSAGILTRLVPSDICEDIETDLITHIYLGAQSQIFICLFHKSAIVQYDLVSQVAMQTILTRHSPFITAISPAANLIAIHDGKSGVSYYALSPLGLASLPSIPARLPAPLSFALDGAWCIVADNSARRIKVFDVENGSENQLPLLKEYEIGSRIYTFAVHCLDKGSRSVCLAAATPLQGGFMVHIWADQSSPEEDLGDTTIDFNPSAPPGDTLQDINSTSDSSAPRGDTLQDTNPSSSAPTSDTLQDMDPAFSDSSASPLSQSALPSQYTAFSKRRMSASPEDLVQLKRSKFAESDANSTSVLQLHACEGYEAPHCISCQSPGQSSVEECRFAGFRCLGIDNASQGFLRIRDPLKGGKPSQYHPWLPNRTESSDAIIQAATARVLIPQVEAELVHMQNTNIHTRNLPSGIRNTCDTCHMGLFFNVWFCATCGWEICGDCYLSEDLATCQLQGRCHVTKANFFPITFFDEEELIDNLSLLKSVSGNMPPPGTLPIPKLVLPLPVDGSRWAPRYHLDDLNDEAFSALLASGEPFVLMGVSDVQSAPSELFGLAADRSHPCIVSHHNGEEWVEEKDSSVEEYFRRWEKPQMWSLQVKDYPTHGHLANNHPALHALYIESAKKMFGLHTSPRGPLNLCSFYPIEAIAPDLGPKMYIAQGDQGQRGTTFIHMDKSGAINLMVYSKSATAGCKTGARWDIWPHSSISALSRAIDDSATEEHWRLALPIIAETTYVNDELVASSVRHGSPPRWIIDQVPGEAVVIPPGCPHQVSNYTNSIKIAWDFVSPTQIDVLQELGQCFRRMNLAERKLIHKDLLHLSEMMWHAWKACK